eukprot:m.264054 g.264054  ORF g.264054 m.264054 type:complete len:98 (-) comp54655_c0_seq9:347-640(-)
MRLIYLFCVSFGAAPELSVVQQRVYDILKDHIVIGHQLTEDLKVQTAVLSPSAFLELNERSLICCSLAVAHAKLSEEENLRHRAVCTNPDIGSWVRA